MWRAFVAALAVVVLGVTLAAGPSQLVRVERQHLDDLSRLRGEGIPVIAEFLTSLVVEGGVRELDRVRALGYEARVLDEDTAAAGYLLVPDGPRCATEDLAALGRIVARIENLTLVRVAPELDVPTSLREDCLSVQWLNRTPLALPANGPPRRSETGRGTDGPAANPLVQQIVDGVEDAEMMSTWVDVTDNPPTGTRYSRSVGCEDASQYCLDEYVALGLDAEFHDWDAQHAPNVVAEIAGAIDPGAIYIVVGHLDDLPSSGLAPGANDNASGSVTVLEAARTMACYSFRNTVRFLNVTGEEQGLLGSDAYAAEAHARGDDIRGVLNFDMNGWEGDGIPEVENLDVSYNSFSQWLGELYAENAETYQTGLSVDAFYCPSLTASDHASFWERGYPAFIGITDNQGYCGHAGTYPDYHESTDTIENCGDPAFFYATVRTAVATLADLGEPFVITFDRSRYACDGAVEVVLSDEGLNADPGLSESVVVTVTSDSEPAGEVLSLAERGTDSKLFSGTIQLTSASAVPGDGLLSVAEGDTIAADYVDPLDCAGNVDALYSARAEVDCTAPLITGVDETGVTDTEATIIWTTDELSDSQVMWGETTPPSTPASGNADTTEHSVPLDGLQECTVYYYDVRSTDEAGNTAIATNGGQYYYFETLGDFGDGLQPCHAGQVSIAEEVSSCEGIVEFWVVDLDLNQDAGVVETATLEVISTSEATPELVTVTETGENTSRFEGSIATTTGTPTGDGQLQTSHEDVVTVSYRDADDGTGRAAVSFETAEIDCAGPVISDLRVEAITDARSRVRFETDEPGDTVVEWGFAPSLGELVEDATLTTSHDALINRLDACVEAFIRVRSRDRFGHETVAQSPEGPHGFTGSRIPGLYWKDDFESETPSWTLQGEWEIGAAQGLGGSSGRADPDRAYNKDRVLGHDLSGQNAHAGDYEPNVSEVATGPTLDASSWTNTKLILHRKLSVGATDEASLWLWTAQGRPIYRNDGQTVNDADYQVESYEIGPFADGSPILYLQFRQTSDGAGQYAGWTVDDVILKDGSLPDYAPCGGCAAAPSFDGATSATDDDACAASGVTIGWSRAVAWGTGGGGSYAVYRDTVPDVMPSPATLVASGVSGTSYNDASPPGDQPLYYLVRAENDESCGAGPANGGLMDANEVRLSVTDWTSRPVPSEIGGLAVELLAGAHVRLTWVEDGDSASYAVSRALSPEPGDFVDLAETTDPVHDDLGAGADLETYFYLVQGNNACGVAGP